VILTFTRDEAGGLNVESDERIDLRTLSACTASPLVEAQMNGRSRVRFKASVVTDKHGNFPTFEIGDEVL
jgi:hypothetical protein